MDEGKVLEGIASSAAALLTTGQSQNETARRIGDALDSAAIGMVCNELQILLSGATDRETVDDIAEAIRNAILNTMERRMPDAVREAVEAGAFPENLLMGHAALASLTVAWEMLGAYTESRAKQIAEGITRTEPSATPGLRLVN